MFGRKTFKKELEKKDQKIDELIIESSGLKADVECLLKGMRIAALYLQKCDQNDYNVCEAMERLDRSYSIVTHEHIIDYINEVCSVPLIDDMQV